VTDETSTEIAAVALGDIDPTITGEEAQEAAGAILDPKSPHAPVRADSPTFASFGVHPAIVESLADAQIERTFAIQELTLPIALAGNDLIGQARTGTGKTLGFGVPLLHRIANPGQPGTAPTALVIAPTRELAIQVSGDLALAGKKLGAKVLTIYGGRAYEPQIEALRKGVDVVVGTPGRLLDLAQQGHLVLGQVMTLVLDEADEMLDLGFLPDIEKLMAQLPPQRQTMLFSATMPGPIVALARKFLRQPIQIRAESAEDDTPATDHIDQFAYRAHNMDKPALLARVLQARGRGLTMIFTRTKRTAAKVADDLIERGFAAAAVHGDLGQGAREQALRAFRTGKVDVLVATDVAARGLDVEGVTHIINYQCPEDEKTYVHRIGRTARAGAKGTAVTLIDWDDVPRWKLICDALSLPFHEPVETYSTSPHLFIELDIPDSTGGTLPRAERTRAGLDAEQVEELGGPKMRAPKADSGPRGARDSGRDGGRDSGRGGRDSGRRDSSSRDSASAPAAASGRHRRSNEGDTEGTQTPNSDAAPKSARNRNRRRTRSGAGGSAADVATAE
jgi:superfamily II DNA/RNA helicase